jgi:hypothetical protein
MSERTIGAVVATTCGTCPAEETPAVGGWATARRNSGPWMADQLAEVEAEEVTTFIICHQQQQQQQKRRVSHQFPFSLFRLISKFYFWKNKNVGKEPPRKWFYL